MRRKLPSQKQLCLLLAVAEVGADNFQDRDKWTLPDGFLDKRLYWHHRSLSRTIAQFKDRFAGELHRKDCEYLDQLLRYRNTLAHGFFALDDLIDKDRMCVEHYNQHKPNEVNQVIWTMTTTPSLPSAVPGSWYPCWIA